MSAFFFGPARRQLFGYYHAPAGVERGSVLILQSWGLEYQYAHRALRLLARRLAEHGWHVLRFDYSGTGDSWGASTDADLERWLEDIEAAAAELRSISGHRHVALAGLRLGGLLAARSMTRLADVGRVVLWDPVTDGEAWLEELAAATGEAARPGDRGIEFGRQTASRTFHEQVASIRAGVFAADRTGPLLYLVTQEAAGPQARPPGVEVMRLPQPAPWIEDISIGSGQIPVKAVTAIVEWLGAD